MKNVRLILIGETLLREALNSRLEQVNAALKPLEDERRAIQDQLKELDNPIAETPVPARHYPIDEGRAEKAIFLIRHKRRGLTVTEVVKMLGEEFEPALIADKETERTNQSRFSTALKQRVDSGELIRVEIEGRGLVHGLPEWFVNGTLLEQYR